MLRFLTNTSTKCKRVVQSRTAIAAVDSQFWFNSVGSNNRGDRQNGLQFQCTLSRLMLAILLWLALTTIVWGQNSEAPAPRISVQQGRLELSEIPSPRHAQGWITDLSGTVSDEAIEYVNRVGDEVNQSTKREMCVVVIKTTSGRNHRKFATDLFNFWGVGNRALLGMTGAWGDNGVLMLIATEDRKAELILGNGIDDFEEVRIAQQIIDDIVVPNFKAGQPNLAIYQGYRACATRLFSVTDLDAPPMLPSVEGGSVSTPWAESKTARPNRLVALASRVRSSLRHRSIDWRSLLHEVSTS